MGLFENLPYTNFHELNLSWFLETFKELLHEWDEQQQEFSDLKDAWQALHDYVENYFDNLDVQQEINNKLDDMLQSGELQTILNGLFASFEYDYNERFAVLEGRMDEFASLPPGATSGNAELLDIRVAADGTTYPSAGDAVRGQIEQTLRIIEPVGLTDLNDADKTGQYHLAYSGTYTNDPIGSGTRRLLRVYTNSAGTLITQIIINGLTGATYYRVKASGTWTAWVQDKFEFKMLDFTGITDLDACTEAGYYLIGYSLTPANDPIGPSTRRILKVYPATPSASYIIQEIENAANGIRYTRYKTGGVWYSWTRDESIYRIRDVSGLTDLDNCTQCGSYLIAYAATPANDPIGSGTRRLLRVYGADPAGNYVIQELVNALDGVQYFRFKTGGVWSAWTEPWRNMKNNISYDFTGATSQVSSDVSGVKLRVASYNVAAYNNDTATYLPENKRFNLKCLLSELDADIIGMQEDAEYIDALSTRLSSEEVYNPILPTIAGVGGPTIRSKVSYVSNGIVDYTVGRKIRYATFDIDGDILLVLSTHPTPGSGQEATRLQQYTELFDWVLGNITLSGISAPSCTWCIITGDMNSESATDRNNLATLAAAAGFTMANGGYLGWLDTRFDSPGVNPTSLDNIICGPNVTITNIKAYSAAYHDLYSDHVPIAADVILM